MDTLSLGIFFATAAWGLIWCLQGEGRLLQLPTLLGGASLAFIVPQGIVIARNSHLVPEGAQVWFYLWSSLCLIVAYWSYLSGWRPHKVVCLLSSHDFFRIGAALIIVAFASFLVILRDHMSQEGGIRIEVTGFQVIIYTVVKLAIPGMTLLTTTIYLGKRGLLAHAILLAGIAIMGYFALYLGRRQWTFAIMFVFVYPAILTHKVRLSRATSAVILSLFLLVVPMVIILLPQYRESIAKGDGALAREFLENPPPAVLRNYFDGGRNLELTQSIVEFDLALRRGEYGCGRGFFNSFIQHYIPAQFVGREFKSSIIIETASVVDLAYSEYGDGHQMYSYISKSGFSDSFTEFGVFGLALYFFLGKIFSYATLKWTKLRDRRFLAFLVLFGLCPMLFVYGQWTTFLSLSMPAVFIYFCLTSLAVPRHARSRSEAAARGRLFNTHSC